MINGGGTHVTEASTDRGVPSQAAPDTARKLPGRVNSSISTLFQVTRSYHVAQARQWGSGCWIEGNFMGLNGPTTWVYEAQAACPKGDTCAGG